jgi:type IV pilus assembly protein PilO
VNRKQLQALILALPVAAVLGAFVYYKYLVLPLAERHKKILVEIDGIRNEYEQSVGRAARLPRLEQEIRVLNEEIIEMQKKLPKNKDVPGIIRLLSERMRFHGIRWKSLDPGSQSAREYYTEHSYKIPFKASYHTLAKFMTEVGQMERIFATRLSPLQSETTPKEGTRVSGDLFFLIYTSK